MAIRELPFDLYVHILEQLTPLTDSAESVSTLVSCLATSSSFRAAASVSGLWEPHYHARYTICDVAKEQSRKQSTGGDWRLMYLERRRIDRETLDILSKMVMERGDGRLERAREVNSMFSFDAWNVLEIAASYPLPEIFNEPGVQERRPVPSHAVPMRFWAQMLLGTIARSHAVSTWGNLKSNDTPKALELSFACVSSFFLYPPMKVRISLGSLLKNGSAPSRSCPSLRNLRFSVKPTLLSAKFLSTRLNSPVMLERSASSVLPSATSCGAAVLKLRVVSSLSNMTIYVLFKNIPGQQFHLLQTRLPHLFLTTHKATIPMSLVYVFVCIAQKMGVTAAPVNFPGRVLAVVSSPDPCVSDIFVDVFGSRTQAILSLRDDIPHLLIQAGITPVSMLRYITPTSCASMLVRTSRNVLASFSIMPSSAVSEDMLHTAFYASLMINVIFMHDDRYLQNIIQHINRFLLDLYPVLVDSLSPLLNSPLREQLMMYCETVVEGEKEAAAALHPRSALTREVKFFVGMVFKHAAYGYVGYIYGWDVSI